MSREQRKKSYERQRTIARIDQYMQRPLRMSAKATESLLNKLCVELGYCLSHDDQKRISSDPPTRPDEFADLVMDLEGVRKGDQKMYDPVLKIVMDAFDREALNES